jgi:sporulation protein YabP
MSEDTGGVAVEHSISLIKREELAMEGVRQVESYSDSQITLETDMGVVIIKGTGLHIARLNLETGEFAAFGFFSAINYVDKRIKNKGKRLLERLIQ